MLYPIDMSTREIEYLDQNFRVQVEQLISRLAIEGVEVHRFFTTRGPLIQAKLWAQSRTADQVEKLANHMRSAGAKRLAKLLRPEFAGAGRWATNLAPGQSKHQYGKAVDCYVVKNGRAVWTSADYKRYAEVARELGLEAGFFWTSADPVHVQDEKDPNPMPLWVDVEKAMVEKFDFSSIL